MYSIFEQVQKKNLSQLTKNSSTFTPKNWSLSSKDMGWGSEIRKKPAQDPGSRGGVKKAPDPGSGSAALLERVYK